MVRTRLGARAGDRRRTRPCAGALPHGDRAPPSGGGGRGARAVRRSPGDQDSTRRPHGSRRGSSPGWGTRTPRSQRWDAALARYESATAIWQQIRDPRGVASGLDKAGLAYFRLGRYEEALAALDRSAEILETGQPAFLAPTLALIGQGPRRPGRRGAGSRVRRAGHRAGARHRQRGSALGVAHRWGSIQRGLGRREEALASFTRASPRSSGCARGVVASDEARAGFLEGKQAVYADTIDLLMELGRVEEALELAERARARAFLDLLGGRSHAGLATAEPLTLAEIRREVSRRETDARRVLLFGRRGSSPGASSRTGRSTAPRCRSRGGSCPA